MPGATIPIALTSGNNVYLILLDQAGHVYRSSTFGFEEPVSASWANYAQVMTEVTATGIYRADMPAVIAGTYSLVVYRRLGGTPAASDSVVGSGEIRWTGTMIEPVLDLDLDASGRVTLAADGLDAISTADPGGVAGMTTLPKMLVALWRWFYRETRQTGTQLTTHADGGAVNTTMAVADASGTQVKGAAT